ncbi:MarR family winged helix-turn-helix transcriptional regulator [Roseateles sp. P5_E7]
MPRAKPSTASDSRDKSRDEFRAQWLQLDRQLCFALYSSSLAMTKLYKPLLAPLGLTYPQYLAMLVLWEADGVSVSQLGQRLSLDSGTLTPLLKRLELLGHIERRRATDDERRVDLFLTPAGRKLRTLALDIPNQLACASACELDELVALTQRLHELRQQLSQATAD